MNILYKSKNVVVIQKDPGLSSVPDLTGAADAMTLLSGELSNAGESGELYPVHRLDKVVGGLIIYARNKKAAQTLSALMAGEGVGKEYLTVCEGELPDGEYVDYLTKDTRQNKAVVTNSEGRGDRACLVLENIDRTVTPRGVRTLLRIRLKTGRFHQIRAQLSHRGAPIVGDSKYGSRDFKVRIPALFSSSVFCRLEDEKINVRGLPDLEKYPWNLFSDESYRLSD